MNRTQFFKKVSDSLGSKNIEYISRAYWFAKEMHRYQKRDSGERYFEHCRRVADTVLDYGAYSPEEITVALLHDCIEDCFIAQNVIGVLFGKSVEHGVSVLSKKIPIFDSKTGRIYKKIEKGRAKYYRGIQNSPFWIRCIKLSDRLDNIKDMNFWSQKRKEAYIEETQKYILPIAKITSTRFYNAIYTIVNEQKLKHKSPQ